MAKQHGWLALGVVAVVALAAIALAIWALFARGATAPLSHRDSRQWTVRYEDGTTTTLQLQDGRFCLYGYDYVLKDTEPISFTRKDGSIQTLKSWDGATVTWETNHKDYPVVYWMLNTPTSKTAASVCKTHSA